MRNNNIWEIIIYKKKYKITYKIIVYKKYKKIIKLYIFYINLFKYYISKLIHLYFYMN